jgi:hypothetical protein
MSAILHSTSPFRYFIRFQCAHCGGVDGFVSRPRNWFEKHVLRLLNFRPARCADCYDRSYRPLGVPLFPHPEHLPSHSPLPLSWYPAEPEGTQKGTNEGDQDLRRIA